MTATSHTLTRRSFVACLAATTSAALVGCGQTRKANGADKSVPASDAIVPAAASSAMTVYRDPSCGCCTAWAEIARSEGYQVAVIDHPNMASIKQQYGIPEELLSCHTTVVGGYAIEGHVPLQDVQRLLNDKPAGIRGIAVAGMPLGSPGMDIADGTKQPFEVMAFDAGGRTYEFNS